MESTVTKLWNKNFSLLVIGQLITIFGNQILTFALPFYILQTQESAALFGTILGLSFIPLIVTAPIGGIMADRLKKQWVMFWLDVTTFVCIIAFMVASGIFTAAIVPLVIVKLLTLNITQSMYIPCVHGGTPLIVPRDNLVRANSATETVTTVSNMVAPGVAGFLLGRFGLPSILVASAVCFAFAAALDLLINFPYEKPQAASNVMQIIKNDTSLAIRFVKERPFLIKIAALMIIVSIPTTGVLMVGVPVFILQNLGISMEHMGIGRTISWGGTLLSAALVGYLGERLTISKVHLFVMLLSLAILPIGIVLLMDIPSFTAFIVMIASDFIFGVIILPYWVPIWAYIQRETPEELVGKVISLFTAVSFASAGVGFLLFGALIDRFYSVPWLIVFVSAFIIFTAAFVFRKWFVNEGMVQYSR